MKARTLAVGFTLVALMVPASASAEDPTFTGWANLLPQAPGLAYDPTSQDDCVAGRIRCVDKVIREMTRRFDALADRCHHNAIFGLTYLRTTEEYYRAATTPGFFEDPAFVNHEDAVFAAFYLRAYDDYQAGRLSAVPGAWRVAFDAARDRAVSASGNIFLGMSAHINRDLPYVLEGIGLVKPDGSSRKADHDKVNEFLNKVSDDVFPEIAGRFDPTVDDGNVSGTLLDDWASFQVVPAWREQAWRNAERLAAARTPVERAQVEASIETFAEQEANALKSATAYKTLLGESSAARDAYRAAHG
jgi:Family of unknown function (DUF5995)